MNEEEKAIEILRKMSKEYRMFGDLDNPEFEDTEEIYSNIEAVLDIVENSTPNVTLYELAREMRRNGSNYWADKLCEKIKKVK